MLLLLNATLLRFRGLVAAQMHDIDLRFLLEKSWCVNMSNSFRYFVNNANEVILRRETG